MRIGLSPSYPMVVFDHSRKSPFQLIPMVYHTNPKTNVLEHGLIKLFHHFSWQKEGDVCDASLTNTSYLSLTYHIFVVAVGVFVSMDIV
jgi:hypothetical protein